MEDSLASAMDEAFEEIRNGRLKSGSEDMLACFDGCSDPLARVFIAYNIAVTFWAHVGNGVKAREFFQRVFTEAEQAGLQSVQQALPSMVPNACENAMHLSLSFDEYFEWAERLRLLDPNDDVLRGMLPDIQNQQQAGVPWSDVLENIARSLYDRSDPRQDRGEYARAVSTYQLVLSQRKQLRLSREAWGRIIYEYGALALRVANDAMQAMQRSQQAPRTEEYSFVVREAMPLLEQYLAANSSDAHARELNTSMLEFLAGAERIRDENKIAVLNSEGLELMHRQDFAPARARFLEAEALSRSANDQEKLQVTLGNLAIIAGSTGDLPGALAFIEEKEQICRALNVPFGLANSLLMKGSILGSMQRTREALKALDEAVQVSDKNGLKEVTQRAQLLSARLRTR